MKKSKFLATVLAILTVIGGLLQTQPMTAYATEGEYASDNMRFTLNWANLYTAFQGEISGGIGFGTAPDVADYVTISGLKTGVFITGATMATGVSKGFGADGINDTSYKLNVYITTNHDNGFAKGQEISPSYPGICYAATPLTCTNGSIDDQSCYVTPDGTLIVSFTLGTISDMAKYKNGAAYPATSSMETIGLTMNWENIYAVLSGGEEVYYLSSDEVSKYVAWTNLGVYTNASIGIVPSATDDTWHMSVKLMPAAAIVGFEPGVTASCLNGGEVASIDNGASYAEIDVNLGTVHDVEVRLGLAKEETTVPFVPDVVIEENWEAFDESSDATTESDEPVQILVMKDKSGTVLATVEKTAEAVVVEYTDWFCIPAKLEERLEEQVKKTDKNLHVKYTHKGYSVEINVPYSDIINTGVEYYGPEYFASLYAAQGYVKVTDKDGNACEPSVLWAK